MSDIDSGYFYVFNHAGSEYLNVTDLKIASSPSGEDVPENTNTTEEGEANAFWTTLGDTEDFRNGSFRLSGNPGAVDDFVRTNSSWSRPAFGSATFNVGWEDRYPLIEFVCGEAKDSGIPDIGGYSNYKPTMSSLQFNGNADSEYYSWSLNSSAPLTL
jgi:hypothetical protein